MYRAISLFVFALCVVTLFLWWNHLNGFNALDGRWWGWMVKHIKVTGNIPQDFFMPLYTVGPVALIAPLLITAFGARADSKTLNGGFKTNELHGTARWADKKDLKKAGLLNKEGVVVGGRKTAFKKIVPLRHDGPEHVLCYAPTRSGKGVGLVIPTLLSWIHSALVLDIKGENHALTSGWRASIGQKIFKFAPAAESGSHRFNPLAEIRIGTGNVIADCQNVAMMMIDPDGKGMKDHWMKDGWGWLVCSILHVIHKVKNEENRFANLRDVMLFMSAVLDDEEADEDAANDGFNEILNDMKAYEHGDQYVNEAVRSGCGKMKIKAFAEKSGVHSSAAEPMSLFADPIVSANVSESDFRLSEIMNGDQPATLYIVIPPRDLSRLRPLIRILMNLFLNFQMQDMEFDNGRQKDGFKHKLLLLLDEFTSIGKLEIFQKSLAYMAGYGLKAYIIVQDMAQLQSEKEGYGRDEAITSNCHVRVAYAPNKHETAEGISKILGKTTVSQVKKSKSAKHTSLWGGNVSESHSETGRELLKPEEVMALKGAEKASDGKKILRPGDMLTMVAGSPPYLGKQYLYFFQKDLNARAALPAVQSERKD